MSIATVASVALAIRVGVAIAFNGFLQPEVSEYDRIARNLLEGRGFSFPHLNIVYYSYIAPLPAWTSAASYWLTGSLAAAMMLQIVAGAMLAVVTAMIAARVFEGWLAPLAAGLLVAVHPGLVVYASTKMHSLALDALFFGAVLLQSYRVAERLTIRRSVELGVIVGTGALSRATILVLLPISGLWLLTVTARASRSRALKCATIATICAVATVAPWIIRNSLLHRKFVPILTTDSQVFWLGNNPYASGSAYIDAEHSVLSALPPSELEDLMSQPDELSQAEWFKSRAYAFIKAHPVAFTHLILEKLWTFWWFSDRSGLLYPRVWLDSYKGFYMGVVVLAAIGAWRLTKRSGPQMASSNGRLLALFLLAISLLQSLYYVEGRHRWAIEPMLLAISGGGAATILSRWIKRTQ
jgi:4-amino-4-deoxy-L-arabinose transferase-like glycosyltransferase